MGSQSITPSKAFKIVGKAGRYQWFLISVIWLTKIFVGLQICAPVITEMKAETAKAALGENNQMVSVVTEFNLSSHAAEISKSIFWVGVVIGNSVLGGLADKYGRKPTLLFWFGINIFVSMASGHSPNYYFYVFGRFLCGIFQGGMFVTVFILGNEIFDKSWWAITGALTSAAWGLGFITLAITGYHYPNWRDLLYYSNLPFIPLLIFIYFVMPESALWLCSVKKYEEAEQVLRLMAKRNGRTNYTEIVNLRPENKSDAANSVNLEQSVSKAIYNSEYRSRLKRATVAWFICGVTSYYLTYAADHLGGTVYENIAFQGVVEIITDIGVAVIFHFFKRKPALIGLWSLDIVMLLFLAISPIFFSVMRDQTSLPRLIVAMITKGAIAAVFCSFWIYTSELFPTSLRSGSQGLCSMVARLGAML